jgi:hypothetical protein
MRRIIVLSVALALGQTNAYADVYVKVDAQGNAIGGAIMCDAATCGAGSEYSRLTLQPGEQYVLQGRGDSGIGNNNPDTQVKVDIPTQTWTVTTPASTQVFTPDTAPQITHTTPTPAPSIIDTSTATTDTTTATTETATATINILDQEPNETWDWEKIIAWVTAWFEKWWRL